MPASPHLDLGHGPVVVLVHGVGVGPESFDDLAHRLADRFRVLVLERPVGPGGAACALDEQGVRLAQQLTGLGAAGGLIVGVSGGATLALATAIRHPEVVGRLVVHEPLLGRLVPALSDRFRAAADLAATGEDGTMAVVQAVMGDRTWQALGVDGRRAAWSRATRWRAEIPAFAAFDPSTADIEALRAVPMLTTVGSRSDGDRRLAAGVLQRLAAADVAEVAGAGNAVQLDAPAEFALVIRSWHPALIKGCA